MVSNIYNLNTPWVESDLFNTIAKKKKNKKLILAKKFNRDGYIIIDLKLNKNFINSVIKDIIKLKEDENSKKNPSIYHYNSSPRLIEGYKKSKHIKQLCKNKKVEQILEYFYDKKPVAINSINFLKGTDQPFHSDYIHFSSYPHKYLAGLWIALEKTDETNGALMVVPGSHKLEIVDYSLFKLSKPKSIIELSKYYKAYEK